MGGGGYIEIKYVTDGDGDCMTQKGKSVSTMGNDAEKCKGRSETNALGESSRSHVSPRIYRLTTFDSRTLADRRSDYVETNSIRPISTRIGFVARRWLPRIRRTRKRRRRRRGSRTSPRKQASFPYPFARGSFV